MYFTCLHAMFKLKMWFAKFSISFQVVLLKSKSSVAESRQQRSLVSITSKLSLGKNFFKLYPQQPKDHPPCLFKRRYDSLWIKLCLKIVSIISFKCRYINSNLNIRLVTLVYLAHLPADFRVSYKCVSISMNRSFGKFSERTCIVAKSY